MRMQIEKPTCIIPEEKTEHMFEVHGWTFANRTYAAEFLTFSVNPLSREQHGPLDPITLKQAQHFVRDIMGYRDITIIPGRKDKGYGTYFYDQKVIRLGQKAGMYVLLHEVAHYKCGVRGHTAHFRAHYLQLVRTYLGDYWADELEKNFTKCGIKAQFLDDREKAR
jgi:hypothetical protein